MSTLSRFKHESPFEVRDKAREIEVYLMKICMNEKYFPKRYRFVLTTDLLDDAHKMVDYLEAANLLPLNPTFAERRETYARYAYIKCENILRKFDLAENLGLPIPNGTMVDIITRMVNEETLINNWIKSDNERLKVTD
jgi:hypothetical protein